MNLSYPTPRAPRTLNKSASAYAKLAAIMETEGDIHFYWADKNEHLIGAGIIVEGNNTAVSFTLEELNEVCPAISLYLKTKSKFFSIKPVRDYTMDQTVRTIWKHCTEKPVLLHTKENIEIYCGIPDVINSVSQAENFMSVVGYRYTLYLDEKDGNTIITQGQAESIPLNALLLDINQLDDVYPGFRLKLKVALALGMPKEEMLKYLFVDEQEPKLESWQLVDPLMNIAQITPS